MLPALSELNLMRMVSGSGIGFSVACHNTGVTDLEKVRVEMARYEHALLAFAAEEGDHGVELVISLKEPRAGLHTYRAPLHPRDIAHPQFPWTFQRFLYDCMHDYLVELFQRTPQMTERSAR